MKPIYKFTTVVLILSAVLVLCGLVFSVWYEAQQSEQKVFDRLTSIVESKDEVHIEESSVAELIKTETSETKTVSDETSEETVDAEETESEVEHITAKRNLAPLFQDNSDCIGWIYIEGTNINYPVMHTPEAPQKYLKKDFYGSESSSGVPFMDYRCTLDTNIIIYGHNMKNGTMFADLKKYLDDEFRNTHSVMEFESENGCESYIVCDVRIVDKYDEWYDKIQSDNKYLTLSTCYGSNKSDRLIVIAVYESRKDLNNSQTITESN